MSVISSDIKYFGSANIPESDSTTSGGAIDLTTKVVFTDISTTDNVTVISDNAGDTTQTVTVYGRNASGSIISEALALNGTTRVTGASLFERILKVVINAAHSGTVTITRDNSPTFTEIATMETGILTLRRLFYNATADASGGSTKYFYEKVFIKNTNGSSALLSATVAQNSDPSCYVEFDLEDAKDDTNSAANRVTAPTGMLGSFDDTTKNVPGTDLGAGETIGAWLKMTLAAGTSPGKSTYQFRVSGSTT